MNFGAPKTADECASVEHLIAQGRDGPDLWDNLVLCHRRCNQKLRDLPLVEKIKMRDALRQRDWLSSMQKQLTKLFNDQSR